MESKCIINCKNETNHGHSVEEIITCIEREVMHLSNIRHKNLVSYEAILCLRRKEGVIIYLAQEFVHGTSVNCISNSLGWSHSGASIITKGVLDALTYLHNKGISHSNINDDSVFLDKSGVCRVTDFSFLSYLNYLSGASMDSKKTGADLIALGHLVASMMQLPNTDMCDFIEQCKSERTLNASDLLGHPFLLNNRSNGANNPQAIIVPERKITEWSMHLMSGRSRLEFEFQVLHFLGRGAYGDVLQAKNNLDNQYYAIKRIPLTTRSRQIFKKMTREVEVLSRLNHENVVRYFNSWIENANYSDLKKYTKLEGAPEVDSTDECGTTSVETENQLCMISKPDESSDWIGIP